MLRKSFFILLLAFAAGLPLQAGHALAETKTAIFGSGGPSTSDSINGKLLNEVAGTKMKIVEGYPNIMPTFQGLVSEEQLLQLIAYVRSLGEAAPGTAGAAAPPPGKD